MGLLEGLQNPEQDGAIEHRASFCMKCFISTRPQTLVHRWTGWQAGSPAAFTQACAPISALLRLSECVSLPSAILYPWASWKMSVAPVPLHHWAFHGPRWTAGRSADLFTELLVFHFASPSVPPCSLSLSLALSFLSSLLTLASMLPLPFHPSLSAPESAPSRRSTRSPNS